PRRLHRAEHRGHRGEFGRVKVERDHVRAAAVHLERVPAAAAAQVEHAVARPDREPAEIDGQHPGRPLAAPAAWDRASWYCSTVAWATAGQANRSLTRRS